MHSSLPQDLDIQQKETQDLVQSVNTCGGKQLNNHLLVTFNITPSSPSFSPSPHSSPSLVSPQVLSLEVQKPQRPS